MKETRGDVATPEELVRALNQDEGIPNCVAEVVCVNVQGEDLKKWLLGARNHHLLSLRCVSEFLYGECDKGMFSVDVFTYSDGCSVRRLFGEGFSLRPGDAVPTDLSVNSCSTLRPALLRSAAQHHSKESGGLDRSHE